MAKDVMEIVKKKLKDGWIKSCMAIEVLAITNEAAESSLTKHVKKMEQEEDAMIYRKEFKETQTVPNPFRNPPQAYSKVVEVELITRRLDDLLYMVMNYGPSSVEILEPGEIKIKIEEAQSMLNSVAEMIHTFAAARQGGIGLET